ncbi:MAG TPA: Ig-like domain-containing protein [Gemmatimonadaceae bacterium]|nr:Ig-like domain-containing protein [Gemmatimonadaceae bacterium]
MLRSTRGIRRFIAGRVVGLGVSAVVAACSNDTTAPLTPSLIAVTGGATQTGTVNTELTQPIAVLVTDADGHPVSGVAVKFAPNANAGTVSATQATTDNGGLAQVKWKIGTIAGLDSMTVSFGSQSAVVTAIGTADVAAQLTIVSGNGQAAPADSALGTPLSVKVTDQYGNAVAGVTVNWSSDDGGILANATTVTDANGIAQDTLILGERGTDDVSVSVIVGTLPLSAIFTEQAM